MPLGAIASYPADCMSSARPLTPGPPWLDFFVGSCRCLLAMLCLLNFSVGSCRDPSQQVLHDSWAALCLLIAVAA